MIELEVNKNKRSLFIVVSTYPFGNGEAFLENEVISNFNLFHKVYFVIPENRIISNLNSKFFVPPNGEIIQYDINISLLEKVFFYFKSAFNRDFWNEVRFMKRDFKSSFNLYKYRTIVLYLSKASKFEIELKKTIKLKGIDDISIYSYWCTEFTYGLVLLKRAFPSFHVFTRMHGWDLYFERNKENYLPFRRPILSELDCTFTVSNQGKNYLQKKFSNIPLGQIKTAFLGTDNGLLIRNVVLENSFTILSLSYISKVKRLDRTIDALASIDDIVINWHHIGSGPDELNIKSYANQKLKTKKNINYVFHGEKSKTEIYEFLANTPIHLLLNTSDSEGVPVSMMEAISFGIPIIAPNVGGISEVVEPNISGYLYPPQSNATIIANCIIKLKHLNNSEYQKLRESAFHLWEKKFNAKVNYSQFALKLINLSERPYQACSQCIIDTIDYPHIIFDSKGKCDICYVNEKRIEESSRTKGFGELDKLVKLIKKSKDGPYDCLIGVSGGTDSSYLVFLAQKWGLNPLLLHVDGGWNSGKAVLNIERFVAKSGFDLVTEVLPWPEIRDLQKSFIKANVIDIDIPFDNAIMMYNYKWAKKFGIKYIFNGYSTSTEGLMPPNFSHYKFDKRNILDIHSRFGEIPLKKMEILGSLDYLIFDRFYKIRLVYPLDYLNYVKEDAKETIKNEFDWQDYGGKHYESVFTRFYQGYILPKKFKIDKRKSHLSMLICSKQLTRDAALKLLKSENPYPSPSLEREDKEYFLKKMGISEVDFEEYINTPRISHRFYKSDLDIYDSLLPFYRYIKRVFNIKVFDNN